MTTATGEVMTVTEAAEFLRCGKSFLYRAVKAGKVPAGRLGNELRFVRDDLIEYVRNGYTRQEPPAAPRAATEAARPAGDRLEAAKQLAGAETAITPRRSIGKGKVVPEELKVIIKREIVRDVTDGKTIPIACSLAGIGESTAHKWRAADPQFNTDIEEAKRSVLMANETAASSGASSYDTTTPPTVEQVREYCQKRDNNVDAEEFVAYHTANNWSRGRVQIRDWKTAVRRAEGA